ncbi:MAG: hypothetical protein FJX67_16900 [Alphaproteobacteria bacterium]|nr:hypothetical protein [Alphaproteobacteria bacterium]
MKFATSSLAGIATAAVLAVAAHAATPVTMAEKTALQVTMQQHIDRALVDGRYRRLDLKTGAVQALHPVTAHPMILRMGDHFVLCADFRDGGGKAVNVDFYIARRGASFVVFQSVVDDRGALEKLMAAGKVARAE